MHWEKGVFFGGIGVFLYLTILAGIDAVQFLEHLIVMLWMN